MVKKSDQSAPDQNELWTCGGPVWINFANSFGLVGKGFQDVTGSVEALTWWLKTVGLSTPDVFGENDLEWVAQLRLACVGVLDNLQSQGRQNEADLAVVNGCLVSQLEWTELEQLGSGRIVLDHRRANQTVMQALGPVAKSLAETLTTGDPARIRTCANPDCVLRFYDDSKNGLRRWCSMAHCGNRAKAAAFQERRRSHRN